MPYDAVCPMPPLVEVLNVRPAPVLTAQSSVPEQVSVSNFGHDSCMLGEINEVLFAHIACPKNSKQNRNRN